MNERNLEIIVNNLQGMFDEEIQHETPYKLEAASRIRPLLDEVLAGETQWPAFLKGSGKFMAHHLGWRVAEDFKALSNDAPIALRHSVARLIETTDAATYYNELRAADVDIRDYKNIRGAGARASVASFFLFVLEPRDRPVYRAVNTGRPLRRVVQVNVNKGSPDVILERYYVKLDELQASLVDRGIPVRHRLDMQGILWIANYKKWFEGENEDPIRAAFA